MEQDATRDALNLSTTSPFLNAKTVGRLLICTRVKQRRVSTPTQTDGETQESSDAPRTSARGPRASRCRLKIEVGDKSHLSASLFETLNDQKGHVPVTRSTLFSSFPATLLRIGCSTVSRASRRLGQSSSHSRNESMGPRSCMVDTSFEEGRELMQAVSSVQNVERDGRRTRRRSRRGRPCPSLPALRS